MCWTTTMFNVIKYIIVNIVCYLSCIFASVAYQQSSNISEITIGVAWTHGKSGIFYINVAGCLFVSGLTEISKAQNANSINILASKNSNVTGIDDIVKYIHKSSELKTCIFYDVEQYFQNIEENQKGFIETTSLIFPKPFRILNEVSFFFWLKVLFLSFSLANIEKVDGKHK